MKTIVMWFRKDLRIEDNAALNEALLNLAQDEQILCVFQLNPQQFKAGTMNHDYFFSALSGFQQTLEKKGIKLHFLVGEPLASFKELKGMYPSWHKVYVNKDERGFGQHRDQAVFNFFIAEGIDYLAKNDSHLHSPEQVMTKSATSYKKFTPYYNQWLKLPKPLYQKVLIETGDQRFINDQAHFQTGERAFKELLKARKRNYDASVGEKVAEAKLNEFVFESMAMYEEQRDFPQIKGTSQLSPYLRTGEISIRKVWLAASSMPESQGQRTFLKELAWRDFYHMIYHYHPEQQTLELQENYRGLPWKQADEFFEKWKAGKTGYPIVDAAMRQLNQTGWMHNRLRMIVASFLTKDLLIDWRLGEQYFAQQLIDYDPASNIGGWQWAASTGTDAVPYFRIFNPTTQSQKFDKEGQFIRQFIPELGQVPNKLIHEPALMTESEQRASNCQIGTDYPRPIVDHQLARKLAIELFKQKY